MWVARALARELGNTELISMVDWDIKEQAIDSLVIGLIFPVHIWGVPRRVLNFLDELKAISPDYIFAVANNAGQVSNTLVQLKKAMASKGLAPERCLCLRWGLKCGRYFKMKHQLRFKGALTALLCTSHPREKLCNSLTYNYLSCAFVEYSVTP